MNRIHGEARLDAVPVAIEGATLLLRIEDCSRVDAPAKTIFEYSIGGISRAAGNADPVQFALTLPRQAPAGGAGWSLRAQLCRNPSGELQPGDYVSTRRYPLAAAGGPMRIMLQRVG